MKKLCFIICGLYRSTNLIIENIVNKFIGYDITFYICLTKKNNDIEYLNNEDINFMLKIIHDKYCINKILFIDSSYSNLFRNSLNYTKKIYDILSIVENNYDLYLVIRSDFIFNSIEFLNHILEDDIIYFSSKKNNQYVKSYDNNINSDIIITKSFNLLQKIKEIHIKLLENNNYLELELFNFLVLTNIKYIEIDVQYKLILSKCNVIAIAGDSGSGKSTLMEYLIPMIFDSDNYIKLETDRYHKWERGDTNYNTYTHLNPEANYLEKMSEDIYNLKVGNEIYTVDYDHNTGKFTHEEKIDSRQNIIVCGLHTLYNDNTNKILNLKIFMDTDRKLIKKWKINRDVKLRGYSIEKALKQIESREEDYEKYIKEQKNNADIIINFYENDNIVNCNLLYKINNNIEYILNLFDKYKFDVNNNFLIFKLDVQENSNLYFEKIGSIIKKILKI